MDWKIKRLSVRRNQAALLAALVVCLLWAVPLVRALRFLDYTHRYYLDEFSNDSWEDYKYACQLLVLYISGTAATGLILVMFVKTLNVALLPHVILALTVLGLIIDNKPEEVITLIPPIINPLFLALGYGFLLILAYLTGVGAKHFDLINQKYPVSGLDQ